MSKGNISKQNKLKHLESKLSDFNSKYDIIKRDYQEKQKELEQIKRQIKNIEQEINKLKNDDLIISEHAILRYIERVLGIDIEEIKHKIVPNKDTIKNLGNGVFPINNFKIKVKDNVVLTVIKEIKQ